MPKYIEKISTATVPKMTMTIPAMMTGGVSSSPAASKAGDGWSMTDPPDRGRR